MAVVTVARFALALVFIAAAVGKLADRKGTVAAAENLGVPPALAGPVATGLPLTELVVAAALSWRSTAVAGATTGMFLLVLFTCLVVFNIRRGNRPPCHCFGRADDAPIGAGTLVQNMGFMALALVVVLRS